MTVQLQKYRPKQVLDYYKWIGEKAGGLIDKVVGVKDALMGAATAAKEKKEALEQADQVLQAQLEKQIEIDNAAKETEQAMQQGLQAQSAKIDAQLQLSERLVTLQKTKLEGEIKSLENLREQKKSRGEQLAATQQIYERQLQIIELEYNSTIAAIDANRTKLQIQESILESKIAEAEVAAAC